MSRIARKISLAKWRSPEWAAIDSIPADAVSADLRTQDNTLSFWQAGKSQEEEDEAILALLGTLNKLEKIDVVLVEKDKLNGISIEANAGTTCIHDLRKLHVDLVNLNHRAHCGVVVCLGEEIYQSRYRQLTRQQVKERIMAAYTAGRVDVSSLDPKLKAELGL